MADPSKLTPNPPPMPAGSFADIFTGIGKGLLQGVSNVGENIAGAFVDDPRREARREFISQQTEPTSQAQAAGVSLAPVVELAIPATGPLGQALKFGAIGMAQGRNPKEGFVGAMAGMLPAPKSGLFRNEREQFNLKLNSLFKKSGGAMTDEIRAHLASQPREHWLEDHLEESEIPENFKPAIRNAHADWMSENNKLKAWKPITERYGNDMRLWPEEARNAYKAAVSKMTEAREGYEKAFGAAPIPDKPITYRDIRGREITFAKNEHGNWVQVPDKPDELEAMFAEKPSRMAEIGAAQGAVPVGKAGPFQIVDKATGKPLGQTFDTLAAAEKAHSNLPGGGYGYTTSVPPELASQMARDYGMESLVGRHVQGFGTITKTRINISPDEPLPWERPPLPGGRQLGQ